MATETPVVAEQPAVPPGIGRSLAEPVWLELPEGPLFAFLHLPPAGTSRSTAVLFCPPFGWEEEMSYRGRRTWADLLAQAGYPTARIDLPGGGDSSGSPLDAGTLERWTGAVAAAAQWLRARTRATRVVALGLGLGGLLAWRATATGAAIDDLALWAVPDTGRRLLREIRAGAGIVSNAAGVTAPGPESAGLEAAGFVINAETVGELERLQLTALPLPDAARRRVLLLTRNGLGGDARIGATLEQAGASVTVADVAGWDELMTDAEKSQAPLAAIEQALGWLGEQRLEGVPAATAAMTATAASVREDDHGDVRVGEAIVRERAVQFERGAGRIFGVLCEPLEPAVAPRYCALLLNAGGIRHTGPNRNWVEIARRWAARGVPSLRIDFEGCGDSDGDPRGFLTPDGPYDPDREEQIAVALRELSRRGLPDRFVLVGLCTSAYTALHAALGSERPAGLFLLNQNEFFWDPQLDEEDLTIKALDSLRGRTWQKLRERDFTVAEVRAQLRKLEMRRIVGSLRQNAERRKRTDRALDLLRDQGTETLFVFGPVEPLFDRLEREGQIGRLHRWPNVTVHRMAAGNVTVTAGDHTFRTVALQREMHACIDGALDRAIARAGS